ncbi:MAG: hypothetical protein COV10_01025 [Candidatus Vogelbacteria bacterium CG10_big_fil_rev_8_21_14_0_10_51_16]|uniref:Uncharacterized protein n=1 Tax=Candidatus Vogelbacteria bacterium CG10_big_fil_rev_8_21_14_0_10_51_16 TaxID=1975045 RepID=A0A2H0REX2_9BACT|nr:MAG: hypothetical protein COV10_01025 [Candidatus Vogelbacteria bacterium CG10_big_fil_rev_8_21_14_0_10_51_16]
MQIEKVYIGGWFQRTTLHLSEIYDFLQNVRSPLDLEEGELRRLHRTLGIAGISLEVGRLEKIKMASRGGLHVNIFEDGLIVLSKKPGQALGGDIRQLTSYYETKLSPAFSYIFSLGAPVPKELANIKNIYPYFVVVKDTNPAEIKRPLDRFEEKEHFVIEQETFSIYRGDKLYIIENKGENLPDIEKFIQEQIFMREFKGQLHRYLNLHRIIWEKIADVKEKGKVSGKNIGELFSRTESYAKTINLIDARINQMSTYAKTREAIIKNDPTLKHFEAVLLYKHETLLDTLAYVKEIWRMTSNYVQSALSLFGSIQSQSTEASVTNLAIITSMGVGATLIGLFSESAPEFTPFGVLYFFILAFVGYSANKIMARIARNREYGIEDVEIAKDIG